MSKKSIYILAGVAFLILVGHILWFFGLNYEGPSEDARDFKAAFELYNGKKNDDGEKLKYVTIDKDNKVKFISIDDFISKKSTDTFMIFMGSPKDNITRSYVETVTNTIDKSSLNELYFLEASYDQHNEYTKLVKSLNVDSIVLPRIDIYKNGEIIGTIESIGVKEEEDFTDLTKEDKEKLKNAIEQGVKDMTKSSDSLVCDENC